MVGVIVSYKNSLQFRKHRVHAVLCRRIKETARKRLPDLPALSFAPLVYNIRLSGGGCTS